MDLMSQLPTARPRRVLVEELDGETLVYDLETHEAHCLNATAAWVWRRLNGRTSVAELASRFREEGPAPRDVARQGAGADTTELIWLALERLHEAGLLEGDVRFPQREDGVSRKEALRMLGRAAGLALLLPAVASVRAPVAAQAASCITQAQCNAINPRSPADCTGLPICNNRRRCCQARRRRRRLVCRARRC